MHSFGRDDYQLLNEEVVFKGFFRLARYSLRHRLFAGGWSAPLNRELFIRGEAVGVLLYDPVNDLLGLVEQFRIGALSEALGPWQYEVVAGVIESGESPEQVALRELEEEAGILSCRLLPIADYLVSTGGTDEKMHLFCGITHLSDCGGIFGLDEEDEDIRFHVWSYDQAMQALADGQLNNAAVTMGMFWLQLNRDELRISSGMAPGKG